VKRNIMVHVGNNLAVQISLACALDAQGCRKELLMDSSCAGGYGETTRSENADVDFKGLKSCAASCPVIIG